MVNILPVPYTSKYSSKSPYGLVVLSITIKWYIYIYTNIYIYIYIYNILVRFLSTQLLSVTSFEPRFRSSSYVVARCTGVQEQINDFTIKNGVFKTFTNKNCDVSIKYLD